MMYVAHFNMDIVDISLKFQRHTNISKVAQNLFDILEHDTLRLSYKLIHHDEDNAYLIQNTNLYMILFRIEYKFRRLEIFRKRGQNMFGCFTA